MSQLNETLSPRGVPREAALLVGLFLFSFALYALMGPGRIDMIDGQWRFEVASNLYDLGKPLVTDYALQPAVPQAVDGNHYGPYGLSGSVLGVPLIGLADLLDEGNRELRHFMFSLLSPLLSALCLIVFYRILRNFDATVRQSFFITCLLGFTSLFAHTATTVFDQNQNTLFLLLAFYFAQKYKKKQLLIYALLGGISLFVLINFKNAYVVFLPGLIHYLGVKKIEDINHLGENKIIVVAYVVLASLAVMLPFLDSLNKYGVLSPPPASWHPPAFDNPILGMLVLLVSPGKSIFLYSPIVILSVLLWKNFYKTYPDIAKTMLVIILPYFLLISSLSFVGGDWSWGPRYLVPILPFIMMSLLAFRPNKSKGFFVSALIALSVFVQCISLTMDHQRFFYERNLAAFFWFKNSSFYFRESALVSRFSELGKLQNPMNGYARPFTASPHPELDTYCDFGAMPGKSSDWVERVPVFLLPRPWPLWTIKSDNELIQTYRTYMLGTFLSSVLFGLVLMLFSLGSNQHERK